MRIKIIDLPADLPDEFYNLPWEVYPERNYWVPPIIERQRRLFSEANSFYRHAEAIALIAYKNDVAVGRLVAFADSNSPYISHGHFGFFEVIDNIDITKALFEEAQKWLHTKSRTKIVGPINFNPYQGYRLQIEGHHTTPFLFEPRNPIYYQEHFSALGMKIDKEWAATKHRYNEWSITSPNNQSEYGLTTEILSSDDLKDYMHSIYKLVTRAHAKKEFHSRITYDEFKDAFSQIIELNNLEQLVVFEGERPIACCIVSVDYSEALQRMDGALTHSHHLEETDTKSLAVKTIAVLEGHASAKVDAIIWHYLRKSLTKTETEAVYLISESEEDAERKYAIFSKAI